MYGAITDMRPRWTVIARGHARGGKPMSLKFNNLNDLIDVVMRLRAFGYSHIRTYPVG